jgi:hypothetical protein
MNIFKPLAFHEYYVYGAILPYTIGMLVYLLDVLLTWYAELAWKLVAAYGTSNFALRISLTIPDSVFLA